MDAFKADPFRSLPCIFLQSAPPPSTTHTWVTVRLMEASEVVTFAFKASALSHLDAASSTTGGIVAVNSITCGREEGDGKGAAEAGDDEPRVSNEALLLTRTSCRRSSWGLKPSESILSASSNTTMQTCARQDNASHQRRLGKEKDRRYLGEAQKSIITQIQQTARRCDEDMGTFL